MEEQYHQSSPGSLNQLELNFDQHVSRFQDFFMNVGACTSSPMKTHKNDGDQDTLNLLELNADQNTSRFHDFFMNVGACTSSPKKTKKTDNDRDSLEKIQTQPKHRLGKIEFVSSSLLNGKINKNIVFTDRPDRGTLAKQRHTERERLRAQKEKNSLTRLLEMLPPMLRNVKTQVKQLTNVVHYMAFLELFVAMHERESQIHYPLLYSLFGPDFRKELVDSFLQDSLDDVEEYVLVDIISNLKTRIDQQFVNGKSHRNHSNSSQCSIETNKSSSFDELSVEVYSFRS